MRTNWLVLTVFALSCLSIVDAQENTESQKAWSVKPDVIYGRKHGMALTYDVITPEKANGAAAIFMVSGGWVSRWNDPNQSIRFPLFRQIVENGYTLFLVRHGSSPVFKVPDAVQDVRRGISHIKRNSEQFKIDAKRMGVFGFSAGGHLSLMLGTTARSERARVAAVCAVFPPTDLRGMVGPSDQFPALDFDKSKADSVSPVLHVTDDDAPTLLIHGTRDRLVPLSHSKNIKKKFDGTKALCELIVIEGAGHGFRGNDAKTANDALIKWFDEHLKVER